MINFNIKISRTAVEGFNPLRVNSEKKKFISIAALVIITRIAIFLIGYLSQMLINNQASGFMDTFVSIWNKWDSPHYLYLAENWYTNKGDPANFIVFYPLYPLLVKLAATTLLADNYFLSGILISNISLVFACYYLYKLVSREFNELLSSEAVKFLLIFPFSFFLAIVYTESLFLLLTVVCFYYLRKGSWFYAGLAGFLAAMTKNHGILLLIPAFIEYIFQTNLLGNLRQKNIKKIMTDIVCKGIFLFFIPLGFLIYLILNKIITGDWFTFLVVQKNHWHNSFGFFADTLKNIFVNAQTWDPSSSITLWIPQLLTFILVLILIFYGINKLRVSYIAYMLAYTIITFSPTWLLSSPRYIMCLFPIYILLAMAAENKNIRIIASFIFTLLLCFYTLAFSLGKSVM